ncbi:BTB/POZ and MATH domain-containing protein 3-like [Lolium perenne]|uniref:BTB/POZ and MATH domain-containing protein 3-like n=1 Tax=Lolium perenne TaxID=4522 RepID=UPI0021F52031|nr:BTB/POZ and MATH domain-containing protein 3-like [Lolium perenne]
MAAAPSASPSPTDAPLSLSHTMSMHSTEFVRGSHQFSIAGYTLHKRIGVEKSVRSGAFEVGGYSWTVRCYPAGFTNEQEGYISLFLELLSTDVDKITVIFSFEIKGPVGNSFEQSRVWNDFTRNHKSWGFRKFAKIESLESKYLMNDCLTIRCTVEVQKESRTGATRPYFITVPPSGICQDLAQLLDSKQGSDVTFQVGQNDYDAHKVVFAMRSPVFSAQFYGLLADNHGGSDGGRHVRIHDLKPATFEAVLHFIYTDSLPPVEDDDDDDLLLSQSTNYPGLREAAVGCSKESRREMICDWLAAADRYDLERMRLLCESALSETIDVENAAGTLELADRHHSPQLKAFCVDYIASPGVLKAVLATGGYRELKANSPSVVADVLEKLASTSSC